MAIHIFIPTLQGVSAVQSLVQEDADVPSVVCLNGSSQSLPISNAYYDFVKKGQGLIARDFQHEAWRVDLSEPVELGESWQLGLYLAHFFHARGELGNGVPESGDIVLWASGAVKVSREVKAVEGIDRKLRQSEALFAQLQARQVSTFIVMCAANHNNVALPSRVEKIELDSVADMTSLLANLPLISRPGLSQDARARLVRKQKFFGISFILALFLAGLYLIVEREVKPRTAEAGAKSRSTVISETPRIEAGSTGITLRASEAEPSARCNDVPLTVQSVTLNAQEYFELTSVQQLCELRFHFAEQGLASAVIYAPDSGILARLERNGLDWLAPLPRNTHARQAWVITFSEAYSDQALDQLDSFLDQAQVSTSSRIAPKELAHVLEESGWPGARVYGFSLNQQ